MNKTIHLKDGLDVLIDKIEAIQEIKFYPELSETATIKTYVRTVSGVEYESDLTRDILLQFLNTEEVNLDTKILDGINKLVGNQQHFSG